MKLPWKKDKLKKKTEELEVKVKSLEEELESYKNRFEAEKERRSKMATEKQEAEEQLNRLKDKLRSLQESKQSEESENNHLLESKQASFGEVMEIISKLESVESTKKDLVTIYKGEEGDQLEDVKGLYNSVTEDQKDIIRRRDKCALFFDENLFELGLKLRPFFQSEWFLSNEFELDILREFIEKKKIWVLVKAGKTEIFEETGGDFEKINEVKGRIDRKHSKGGFSQGRFERKREEQINQHLDEVSEKIREFDEVYLLGEKRMCKDLEGVYLGGFDPNRDPPEVFYGFQLLRKNC